MQGGDGHQGSSQHERQIHDAIAAERNAPQRVWQKGLQSAQEFFAQSGHETAFGGESEDG